MATVIADADEIIQSDKRIRALEKQCAVLAAEIDRMAQVVHVTCKWRHLVGLPADIWKAVDAYEAAREGGDNGS